MPVTRLDPTEKLHNELSLWRYMKVSTFFLLLEGKAFLPSVATLQRMDPIEGGIRPDSPSLLFAIKSGDEVADSEFQKWLLNQEGAKLDSSLGHFTAWQNSGLIAEIYMRQLAKRRAAWCWFSSNLESAGMWHVYGSNGLAIRTSLSVLVDSLPEKRDFQIAPIRYVDRRSSSIESLHPRSEGDKPLVYRPHLLKVKEYEHEREVRVTTTCNPSTPGKLIRGIRSEQLVKEIVFSPLMPREEAKALEKWIEKFSWDKTPPMRRSSLVGVRPDFGDFLEETLEETLERYGFLEEEDDLPPLMKTL